VRHDRQMLSRYSEDAPRGIRATVQTTVQAINGKWAVEKQRMKSAGREEGWRLGSVRIVAVEKQSTLRENQGASRKRG
jgi:hypothetical protein